MAPGIETSFGKMSTKVYVDEEEAGRNNIMRVSSMCTVPFALTCAMELGVIKILMNAGLNGSLTASEIAERITVPGKGDKADPENLERILRLLACHDLFKETAVEDVKTGTIERRYGPNVATKYLLDDADKNPTEASKHESLVEMISQILSFCDIYPAVYKSVLDKTKEAFVLVRGKSVFQHYAENPEEGAKFNKAMANCTSFQIRLLLEKYDGYKNVKTLVDVGGGTGANVASIVAKYPHIRGINFDLPHVVKEAPQYPGVEHVGGSFMEKIPDCDAVVMKYVLHDWSDEICTTILKTIHKALPEDGKIINVDTVLPETFESSVTAQANFSYDFVMMAICTGGKERTLAQFRKLGASAGFPNVAIVGTSDNLSIMEFYKK